MAGARPDTWMPMYWGDYTKDTGHLSAVHHGAYLMLIKHYWSTGKPLPDDDSVLWRVACADSLAHWRRRLKPVVMAFFRPVDGTWFHPRVDAELRKAEGKMLGASERARRAAEARWGHASDEPENQWGSENDDAPSNASSMHQASPENASSISQAMLGDATSQSPSPSPSQSRSYSTNEAAASSVAARASKPTKASRKDEDQAFADWQRVAALEGWPNADFLNSTRRYGLQTILGMCGGIEGWRLSLDQARASGFLRAKDGKMQGWFDLDWMLKVQNFTRLMEGRYAERHAASGKPTTGDSLSFLAELRREDAG